MMDRTLLGFAAAAACVMCLSGCGDGDALTLVPVAGKVFVNGKPLDRGAVSLRAKDGGHLHQPTGKIERDGSYKLFTIDQEGAPPGEYKVLVFADANTNPQNGKAAHPAMPKWLVNPRYTSLETTNLSLNVVAGASPGAYDLQLQK